VEQLVTQYADRQICFIEGQGSLAHPAYSAVTLALIHGSCPDAMVMCHRPDRRHYHGSADCPLMPLDRQIRLYEAAAAAIHPAPVVAVAVNTAGMEEPVARRHIDAVEAETALPACDPVRDGVERILQAVRHAVAI
jgi:uncharacterized NAD-dependent epimerase/dehydratase family protein